FEAAQGGLSLLSGAAAVVTSLRQSKKPPFAIIPALKEKGVFFMIKSLTSLFKEPNGGPRNCQPSRRTGRSVSIWKRKASSHGKRERVSMGFTVCCVPGRIEKAIRILASLGHATCIMACHYAFMKFSRSYDNKPGQRYSASGMLNPSSKIVC